MKHWFCSAVPLVRSTMACDVLFRALILLFVFEARSSPYNVYSGKYITEEFDRCLESVDAFFDLAALAVYKEELLSTYAGFKDFDCSTMVRSRSLDTGIISVVQKMTLRKDGDCLDYVQVDGESPKCGEVLFGSDRVHAGVSLPPRLVSNFSGPYVTRENGEEVGRCEETEDGRRNPDEPPERVILTPPSVTIVTGNRLVLRAHVDSNPWLRKRDKLELVVAITPYKDCDALNVTEGMFNCGYGLCISSKYVRDGVVNCPFGDCRDEGSCEEVMETSYFVKGGRSTAGFRGETVEQGVSSGDGKAGERWSGEEEKGASPGSPPEGLEDRTLALAKRIEAIGEEFARQNKSAERIRDYLHAVKEKARREGTKKATKRRKTAGKKSKKKSKAKE